MSNKTRKRFLPVALVMAVAVIGVVALALALTSAPRELQAHGGSAGDCSTDLGRAIHDALSPNDPCPTSTMEPTMDPAMTPMPTEEPSEAEVKSSSTSASSTVELKLTIAELSMPVAVGGSIVLYLEDDFQEPDSISAGDAYFVVSDPVDVTTGNGGRVYTTVDPVMSNDDYFTADKDDIAIQVFVPDLCPNATDNCEGDDGLNMGDTVSLVLTKGAGIKNPSEQGTHSTGYKVLSATHTGSVGGFDMATDILNTYAKIGLSDVDNSRGYEMIVTGSGFNNGTTAGVYVLPHARYAVAEWWETLSCDGMKAAMGTDSNNVCFHYDLNEMYMSYSIASDRGHADFLALSEEDQKKYSDMVFTSHLCRTIIEDGTKAGSALVGSDDKAAVTFEVTVPTFKPGNVNYICMVDGEGRMSNRDVEDFNLQPSIAVVPGTASTGDTVNVFAQDYHNNGQSFSLLKIGGRTNAPNGMPLGSFISDREVHQHLRFWLDHLRGSRWL